MGLKTRIRCDVVLGALCAAAFVLLGATFIRIGADKRDVGGMAFGGVCIVMSVVAIVGTLLCSRDGRDPDLSAPLLEVHVIQN